MSSSFIITHSVLKELHVEKVLSLGMLVSSLKDRLYMITATSPHHQRVQLRDRIGNIINELIDDTLPLSAYIFNDSSETYVLHIIDTDPASQSKLASFSGPVSAADASETRYEMSDEDYNKRKNTARKFIQQQRKRQEEENASMEKKEEEDDERSIEVGMRCQEIGTETRGIVKFIGELTGKKGITYIGVHLDEPLGKNNGSYKGISYFDCSPKYGKFYKSTCLEFGNFPEIDDFEESDEEL